MIFLNENQVESSKQANKNTSPSEVELLYFFFFSQTLFVSVSVKYFRTIKDFGDLVNSYSSINNQLMSLNQQQLQNLIEDVIVIL